MTTRTGREALERRFSIAALALAISLLGACSDDTNNPAAPPSPPAPEPDPTPTSVEIAFCNGAEPQWVAFQDGDGEWTRAQPTISGT